jgi:hypothetical protein
MGDWQLDPYHTQVEFAAKHLGMMTVRGHFAEVSSDAQPAITRRHGSAVRSLRAARPTSPKPVGQRMHPLARFPATQ